MIDIDLNVPDVNEIIRDKIALILVNEFQNQATLYPSSPAADVVVCTEHAQPFDIDSGNGGIVNIWFDNDSSDESGSSSVDFQRMTGTFSIDCYCSHSAEDLEDGGYIPGDESAARAAHRLAGMVRKILHAGEYTYLDMRGVVGGRRVVSRTAYQPLIAENQPAPGIKAVRLQLQVIYREYSPQAMGEIIEEIRVNLIRGTDGLIYTSMTFNVAGD